jgi:integrase
MTVISKTLVDSTCAMVYNRHTVATYRSQLHALVGVELTKEALQREVIKWAGLAKSTITVRKAALRLLVDTAQVMGMCEIDLLDGIRWPHGKPKEKRPGLSSDEIEAIFNAIETDEEKLLMLVLFDTGLRLGTVTELTFGELQGDSFVIKTKRGTEVTVYPTGAVKKAAATVQASGGWPLEAYAFGGEEKAYYKKLYRTVTGIGKRAGVEFVPHQCRHTFITRIIDATGDITLASIAAGHKSIQTTMGYRHTGVTQVKDAVGLASIGGQYA